MIDQSINLAKNIFDSQNIQSTLLTSPFDNISEIDYSLRSHLYPQQNPYEDIKNWLIQECSFPNIYLIESSYHFCNVYLKLPIADDASSYLSIGPFLFSRPTEPEIQQIAGIYPSPHMEQELKFFYNNLPLTFAREKFQAFITALFSPVLGPEMRIIYQSHSDVLNNLITANDFEHSFSEGDLSLNLVEQRYQIEQQMIAAVKQQNIREAIRLHKKMIQFNYGQRTSNQLRNSKNFMIVFNTLLRAAARECEVHPFYIDKISHQFAIEIEQCTNDLQLMKLSADMIRKYCLLIHNHSVKKYSDNIQDCVTYIDLHYNENLTLKKMAEYLNLNSSYLSTLFKKELGKTVTEYITQTRIKQALLLLNSTKHSIREVANQCGFDDINYFSRIFKKYEGMSPSSYRKMIQDN
ncbi:AraC family transcriptional regulator [Clostridium boliviensis]|uniref:AraC family transcriptional regulator n=1 Tax=Clostridium boliviensis TaxID=318465 RepID=A0ABU4GGR6_9CLOT|nr:AraC family transcriptional regulator [Clostridium boliviensis]MDW2796207.1 AraC family transcriptional regulator [Clostridium boliviensis]